MNEEIKALIEAVESRGGAVKKLEISSDEVFISAEFDGWRSSICASSLKEASAMVIKSHPPASGLSRRKRTNGVGFVSCACGASSEAMKAGVYLCGKHLEMLENKERNASGLKYAEYNKMARKRFYEGRKARCVCTSCGAAPPREGRNMCKGCAAKHNKRQKAYQSKP